MPPPLDHTATGSLIDTVTQLQQRQSFSRFYTALYPTRHVLPQRGLRTVDCGSSDTSSLYDSSCEGDEVVGKRQGTAAANGLAATAIDSIATSANGCLAAHLASAIWRERLGHVDAGLRRSRGVTPLKLRLHVFDDFIQATAEATTDGAARAGVTGCDGGSGGKGGSEHAVAPSFMDAVGDHLCAGGRAELAPVTFDFVVVVVRCQQSLRLTVANCDLDIATSCERGSCGLIRGSHDDRCDGGGDISEHTSYDADGGAHDSGRAGLFGGGPSSSTDRLAMGEAAVEWDVLTVVEYELIKQHSQATQKGKQICRVGGEQNDTPLACALVFPFWFGMNCTALLIECQSFVI
jgi:hypothetical protein